MTPPPCAGRGDRRGWCDGAGRQRGGGVPRRRARGRDRVRVLPPRHPVPAALRARPRVRRGGQPGGDPRHPRRRRGAGTADRRPVAGAAARARVRARRLGGRRRHRAARSRSAAGGGRTAGHRAGDRPVRDPARRVRPPAGPGGGARHRDRGRVPVHVDVAERAARRDPPAAAAARSRALHRRSRGVLRHRELGVAADPRAVRPDTGAPAVAHPAGADPRRPAGEPGGEPAHPAHAGHRLPHGHRRPGRRVRTGDGRSADPDRGLTSPR